MFYSHIKKSNISDEDYNHACNVFKSLDLADLGEYSDLYLKTDVLLLSDIFENFQNVTHSQFNLDPCHYYSSPELSYSAMLKMTKIQLQLITEIEELELWERATRGGVSYIGDRYALANNPYVDTYDATKPTSYIQFLNANNLYGWVCQQPLPIRNFRHLS